MSAAGAAFLFALAVIWGRTTAFSDDAMDCCLSTSGVLVPRHIAVNYIVQTTDSGCPIPATMFVTKRKRKLCSPPAEDGAYPWVAKLIAHLDKQRAHKGRKW